MNLRPFVTALVETLKVENNLEKAVELHTPIFEYHLSKEFKDEFIPKPLETMVSLMENKLLLCLKNPATIEAKELSKVLMFFDIDQTLIKWENVGKNPLPLATLQNTIRMSEDFMGIANLRNAEPVKTRKPTKKRNRFEIKYHPLTEVRRDLKLTIQQVAEVVKISKTTISKFECQELRVDTKRISRTLSRYYKSLNSDKISLQNQENKSDDTLANTSGDTDDEIKQYYDELTEKLQNSGSDIPPLFEEKNEE